MTEPTSHQKYLVLYIDDEPPNLLVRKLLLEKAGFEVRTATNGKEGLQVFASQPIDAVIVDYSMPGMDGVTVATLIKQQKPRVPVIMLSAYPGAREIVDEIVDAFVEKGVDPTLLVRKVESLTRLRSHSHPELNAEYVIFADASRRCLDCSDPVCKLLGYSRADLLEKTLDDISYKPVAMPALLEDHKKDGILDGEFILKHRNGRPLLIRFHSWSFPDSCLAAVWEPVSDWKELYRAAMLELDPGKLKGRIEVALLAIHRQLREIGETPSKNTPERVALNDALNGLRVLQRETK
ncbi:MAG TPA: response regulator [Candidatus Dormibacteraeota bacterium]|nr:response regulator [Candidatus Dormibacteraeota bacterium]